MKKNKNQAQTFLRKRLAMKNIKTAKSKKNGKPNAIPTCEEQTQNPICDEGNRSERKRRRKTRIRGKRKEEEEEEEEEEAEEEEEET